MKIKILYENKDILAIDKPSGVLVDTVAETYPKFILAHRLDQETSGVLLLAKNKKAHQFLKEQFQARTIKKVYLTIVNGWVKNDRGIINKPIGRSPKDFRRHSAGRGARGELREAETFYKVLKRLILPLDPSFIKEGETSLDKGRQEGLFTVLEVRPKTGRTHQIRVHMKYLNHPRTHQIRVHMKYLNHPVVGDELYNPNGLLLQKKGRMMLHARSIEFQNLKGENVKIESSLPKEFNDLLKSSDSKK